MTKSVLLDASTPFGERVQHRLREEQVIWTTTVGKDGTPQPNPVGFLLQDDNSILIYNAVKANRISHMTRVPGRAGSDDQPNPRDPQLRTRWCR